MHRIILYVLAFATRIRILVPPPHPPANFWAKTLRYHFCIQSPCPEFAAVCFDFPLNSINSLFLSFLLPLSLLSVAGIVVEPPPRPTATSRINLAVGGGTSTFIIPGTVAQVGVYCPIMATAENPTITQRWIRNGTEVNSTTPSITLTVVGGRTYRLVEDFMSGLPPGCIEYECIVNINNEEFSESVELCARGTF